MVKLYDTDEKNPSFFMDHKLNMSQQFDPIAKK